MLSRIMISVAVATALIAAPVSVSARSCILSNASSEKACQPACCANKTCCETSQKNTAPAAAPLEKSLSDQQNIAAYIAAAPVAVLNQAATSQSRAFYSAAFCAHSPPTLALICIRLI
jgi:hypothetical protein